MKKTILLLLSSLLLFSCAAHTHLQPLGKGNVDANVSFGGPIIKALGTQIPVPYLTGGLEYGASESINLFTNLHMLPLAYKMAGLDAGFSWYPIEQNGLKPTIGIHPFLMCFASLKSDIEEKYRVYPVVSFSSAWQTGKGQFFGGLDMAAPISDPDYDDDAESLIFSPFVGYEWKLGRNTRLITEIKWNGSNIASENLAVDYLPISGYGAITTLFALERSFK